MKKLLLVTMALLVSQSIQAVGPAKGKARIWNGNTQMKVEIASGNSRYTLEKGKTKGKDYIDLPAGKEYMITVEGISRALRVESGREYAFQKISCTSFGADEPSCWLEITTK